MKIIQCRQGSHEWFSARCGRVTASEVHRCISFLKRAGKSGQKGEESAARASYKAEIVGEILTGEPNMEGFLNSFMSWGIENEPYACAAYEVSRDVSVDKVGFIVHPTIERAGASPDGLVGKNGGIEIKCPKTSTHIQYMMAGILPPEYEPQVMFNLACSEREWWDFVSFDTRILNRHQLFIKRVYRNEARIKEIEAGITQFLAEVDELIEKMNALNPEQISTPKPEVEGGITDDDLPTWYKQLKESVNEPTGISGTGDA
jgi:hypothetical protein